MKRIDCVLTGGLGNQLYNWAFAAHLSKICGSKLKLHWDSGSQFGLIHDSSLREIHIPVGKFCLNSHPLLDNLQTHNYIIGRNWSRTIHEKSESKIMNGGLFNSDLEELRSVRLIAGSNFSPNSIVYLKNHGFLSTLNLKKKSIWYQQFCEEIDGTDALAIHVRRGDFMKNLTDGILKRSYYENAIEAMRTNINQRIYVFSDGIQEAQNLLSNVPNLQFVIPPPTSKSIESLFLLSKFSSLVVSNSTFSVWAGILAKKDTIIYRPSSWEPSRPELLELFPTDWIPINI
jgi:hypothetical protein